MSEQRPVPPGQPPRPPQVPHHPSPVPHPPHGHPPQPPPRPAHLNPAITGVSAGPLHKEEDLEPISLVGEDDAPAAAPATSKIRALGVGLQTPRESKYKRQPHATGHGAVRVRSFHGRMSDEGLQFLDDKINEWLDSHPEIEVKFVTSTIGQFEGKIREPALVLNVWY